MTLASDPVRVSAIGRRKRGRILAEARLDSSMEEEFPALWHLGVAGKTAREAHMKDPAQNSMHLRRGALPRIHQ